MNPNKISSKHARAPAPRNSVPPKLRTSEMPKQSSQLRLSLRRTFRGSDTSDPSTKAKSPNTKNQKNPLIGHQILTDREKASDANSLNIMTGLLHIKVKHPIDSSISSDIMAGLLHIKMKHLADSFVPYNMSVRHHHLKICPSLAARGAPLAYKGSTMPHGRGLFSL